MAEIESFNQKVLTLAEEPTYGTDAAPTAADAIFMLNGRISVQTDRREREVDHSEYQSNPFVLAGKRCVIEFEAEVVGGGGVDTPPAIAPLLEAGGMSETITATTDVVYDPISSGFLGFTAYFSIGNYLWKVVGCRLAFELMDAIGDFRKIRCTLTGLYATPVDQAPADPTFAGWRDPLVMESDNWDLQINNVVVNARELTVNINNRVVYYEGSEKREVTIIDRAPSGTLVVYAPTIAEIDLHTLAEDHTKIPLVSTHGTVAGDITEYEADEVQLGMPEPADVGDEAFGFRIPFTVRGTGWRIRTQ